MQAQRVQCRRQVRSASSQPRCSATCLTSGSAASSCGEIVSGNLRAGAVAEDAMVRDESRPALLVSFRRPAVPAAEMMEDDVRDNMAALRSRQVRSAAKSIEPESQEREITSGAPRGERRGKSFNRRVQSRLSKCGGPPPSPPLMGATRSQVAAAGGQRREGGEGGSRFSPPALFFGFYLGREHHTRLSQQA